MDSGDLILQNSLSLPCYFREYPEHPVNDINSIPTFDRATVGFLSVSNLPEGAQVAATVSALTSLGSIIIGVFAIWRHQANTTTADSVCLGPFSEH